MIRRTLILFTLLCLFVFFGCAPPIIKTELDVLFEKNFEGFESPEVTYIKKGVSRNFPYATYDQVWDATILVMIQQGIIVRSSKDDGIIVTVTTPPLAIFVERGEVVTVYLNWMTHLYRRIDKPEVVTVAFELNEAQKIAETFFGKLATQLYAAEKWKWLKAEEEEGKK